MQGRHAKDKGPGLPKLSELVLEHDDGRTISAFAVPSGTNVRTGSAIAVKTIPPARFEFCPICYESPADTKEHVPPQNFGGRVMTWTCARCNNTLGSRTEAAMQDWFDNAVRVHYTEGSDPRPFGHTRALILTTAEGESVLMPERGSDPGDEFTSRLKSQGEVEAHFQFPRPEEYRAGFLKNAYLAAALHIGGVPDIPSANEIRAELQTILNASSRKSVVLGDHASKLRFHRTGTAATGPSLALLRNTSPDECGHFISLAGTVLVSWPFPEIDPERFGRYPITASIQD